MLISGIFFEAGGISRPSADEWAALYAQLEGTFAHHSVTPTYYAIDNFRRRAKFKKYGGEPYHRRLAQGFDDVEIMTLASTPPGIKNPGYNWNALCTLTYIEGYGRLSLEVLINQSHLPFGDAAFESTINSLAEVKAWDFGWAMQRRKSEGIETYLAGTGWTNGLDSEDRRRIELWYDSYSPDVRRETIRDIFPFNVIGPGHLARRLRDGRSLVAFIKSNTDSELRPLTGGLWLWKVRADRTENVRDALRGSGIIASE